MLIASSEFAPGLSRYLLAWLHWLPSSGHAIARIRVSSPKKSRTRGTPTLFCFMKCFPNHFLFAFASKKLIFCFWSVKSDNANGKTTKKYPRVWKRNLTQRFSGVKARFGSTCAPTTEHVECSELMLFAKTSVVIIKATNRSVTKGRGPKPQIKTPFRNMDILAVSHREVKKKCVIMSHLKFPLGIGFHRDHRDNFHQIDVKALSKVIDQSGLI